MKKFIGFIWMLFLTSTLCAQQPNLVVKRAGNDLYLEHKVSPKENFFSIGRLYYVHPKFIATFNKLDMNKGLAIGQTLRIPLTDTNFVQKGNSGTPVYYVVGENEGLMKVSSLNKDVTLENLRNWNSLPDNVVQKGAKLIVGFLSAQEMPSATIEKKEVIDEVKPAKEEIKTEPVVPQNPVEIKVETTEPKNEPVFAKNEKPAIQGNGYFKYHFEQQIKQSPARKDATVTSGIFKTTSGWKDGKYYLLVDNVSPGTIVKLTNPSNNQFVYAKVLGEMSGIRQNTGLDIRISNAAATALQVGEEEKFILKILY